MCKTRSIFNGIFVLILVFSALGTSTVPVRADNCDTLRADPRLLQLAAENPDATFMVIVQKLAN